MLGALRPAGFNMRNSMPSGWRRARTLLWHGAFALGCIAPLGCGGDHGEPPPPGGAGGDATGGTSPSAGTSAAAGEGGHLTGGRGGSSGDSASGGSSGEPANGGEGGVSGEGGESGHGEGATGAVPIGGTPCPRGQARAWDGGGHRG